MIIGIIMVRDEADIIEPVLRHHLAEGVDRIIVADNLSADETPAILARLAEETGQLVLVDDPVLAYEQSKKMSRLAQQAHDLGADWVLPFDADEIWYGVAEDGQACRIADALEGVEDRIVMAPGWDHIVKRDTSAKATVTDRWCLPFSPFRRQQTQQLCKVAFRATQGAILHMGNHDVEASGPRIAGPLAFRHFQYRSLEQMKRKLRQGREAYEASDIHPMHGTHWRQGGLLNDQEMADKWSDLCSEEGLVYDPAPIRVTV